MPQGDALAGAAPAEDDEAAPGRDLERHVVQHPPVAERLGDALEPDGRGLVRSSSRRLRKDEEDQPHQHDVGDDDARIDDSTTARVDARPTPSVPDSS